jgi:hypothetical protein
MDDKDYIAALIKHRQSHADDALNQALPEGREAGYMLGLVTGFNRGLRMAEKIYTDMLKSEREKDV